MLPKIHDMPGKRAKKQTVLGTAVQEARGRAGLNQTELALKAHVDRVTINEIENGWTEKPRAETLERLAHALGVTVRALKTGNLDDKSPDADPKAIKAGSKHPALLEFFAQYGKDVSPSERIYLEHSTFIPDDGVPVDVSFYWAQWQWIRTQIARLRLKDPGPGAA